LSLVCYLDLLWLIVPQPPFTGNSLSGNSAL
jgi:hypothetical protein